MAAISPIIKIANLRTIPCPRDIPANPDAIPVAKGFTVEPKTPTPAPRSITATAVIVS